MKCSECGARISSRAKFCSKCGRQSTAVTQRVEDDGELKAYAKDVIAEGQVAAGEIKDAAIKGLKSETGKSMLVWGAFGAVAGAVLPFVGPVLIGSLGAAYGAAKKLTK
jgi:hypothetical protein